jgi:two-component system chemotaxis sensor kinase CheA
LNALPHIAGASVGGDGSIDLILRSSVVLESALRIAQTYRDAPVQAAPAPAPKRVLLVDDSVTTRTLERSILEAAGYTVLTAADGRAAWALLNEETVDLVVSDVDMPSMDGIALVEAIRGSSAMRELPVILVTARESERDRQRGLEAGADAYIVKSSFRQEELLDAIGGLT